MTTIEATSSSMTPLFRSERYRTLAGVCAGIALARGWSILLVRIVALLVLFGTGIGFIAYLAAWILLPKPAAAGVHEPELLPHDPLMRSRADRKIAGVCAGLAKTLALDPSLVRVGFVLMVLFAGVGLVPYVYAWIAVPSET